MKCSVIISTYTTQRLKEIIQCLGSLQNQSTPPEEVLIVLDPFRDLIEFYLDRLREFQVKIVISEDFGLSNARNTGIRTSKGDIIVFIDDDIYVKEDWLEKILENFKDNRVWIVGGKIIPEFETSRPRWFPEELDWIVGCTYKGMPDYKTEIRNPIGANMAFRREVFEKVGFFETLVGRFGKKLLGSEETELCLRVKNKYPEVKIIYAPAAIVYHKVPKERTRIGYVLKRAYYEGVSKAILSNKFKLKDEKNYLKFLFKSLGRYLVHFELSKCFTIILVILATATGFLVQKITTKLQRLFGRIG
ncbi:MAG: glycosyltransferase family 2 protein [Archaeoglobaceae archaeon]